MQINGVGAEGLNLIRPHTDNMVVRMHVDGRSMKINHLGSWNWLGGSRCGGWLDGYLPNPRLGFANPPMLLATGTLTALALTHGTNTLARERANCHQDMVSRGQEVQKGKYSPRRDHSRLGDDG